MLLCSKYKTHDVTKNFLDPYRPPLPLLSICEGKLLFYDIQPKQFLQNYYTENSLFFSVGLIDKGIPSSVIFSGVIGNFPRKSSKPDRILSKQLWTKIMQNALIFKLKSTVLYKYAIFLLFLTFTAYGVHSTV